MSEFKRPAEKMEFRGFTRTALVTATWPLAKFSISGNALAVRGLVPLASVNKEDICRIELFEGRLCPSIKVWNNSKAFPLFQFWSFRAHQIARTLESHGYRVQKKESNSALSAAP